MASDIEADTDCADSDALAGGFLLAGALRAAEGGAVFGCLRLFPELRRMDTFPAPNRDGTKS